MIEIVAITGVATVQDGGRPGRMHEGVPPGGALVRSLLGRANAGAFNPPREAALEVLGTMTVRLHGALFLASDDSIGRPVGAGETWTISSAGVRARYLAVRGGIDVPLVLGSRGTLLVAGLGGCEGRALRKGDRLRVGHAPRHDEPAPPAPDLLGPVRVVPGPDLDRFAPGALDVLLAATYVVSARSDRVGIRLSGPPLPRLGDDAGVSAPMVKGAIQVPASGEPIVLGPDHPTTGGYPVLATILGRDLDGLMGRPIGATVRLAVA